MDLRPHPRLYTSLNSDRPSSAPDVPVVKRAVREVRRAARDFLSDPTITVDETGHNYHLIRARRMQTRVVTLLTAYGLNRRTDYRDAVLADVRRIAAWEYWSWITWRKGDARPESIFDLSYGENSATLAIAYDWLHDELDDDERALFVDTAERRSFKPYLAINGGRTKSWYFRSPNSNWNTVCNGGAGMLALAIGDASSLSRRTLSLVERGVAPFFESLRGDGGWPEGIGYWNYGMRYGFMYLLSHERATGRRHPLMKRAGTEATLSFPLAFSPNGQACSFGDVNRFAPLPFHYAAAARFRRADLVELLDRRVEKGASGDGPWPNAAETVLLHPGRIANARQRKIPDLQLVRGLEWGYVADRMPEPRLYVSARGGTTDAPHVHRDLMSLHVVAGDETLIESIPVQDYVDTTFSARRFELYETSAASKNTIFINGVGTADAATVKTRVVKGRGWRGFRIDATSAMGTMYDGPAATFCGRAVLMVKDRAVLVIDRVKVPHVALIESRLHTFHRVRFADEDATIRGRRSRLHVTYASTEPTRLKAGMGMQTHAATDGDTILRRVTTGKVDAVTVCTLMTVGGEGQVALSERGGRTTVRVTGAVSTTVAFDTDTLGF